VPGDGGSEPTWRGDGRELFYLTPDRMLMSVPVSGKDNQIQFGQPVALFKTGLLTAAASPLQLFDVSEDGQHFLLGLPAAASAPPASGNTAPPTPITVVVNWTSLVGR
jgi:hypothetical protein